MKKNIVCILAILVGMGLVPHASAKEVLNITHSYFEPFVWSEDGVSKGIYVDVIKEAVENRMGIEVQFTDYPWKRAQILVKKGKADGFITIPTSARLEYAEAGNVYVAMGSIEIVTYSNHPRFEDMKKIQKIPDLQGYKILTYIGNGWAEKNLVGLNVEYGGITLKEVLMKLAFKRGDVVPGIRQINLYNIKKFGFKDDIVEVPGVVFNQVEYKLLIGKKSPYLKLLPKIDQKIAEIRNDGALESILQRYR